MHSNRLIHETSPYLLQHAHNPVDWYPWGEEALQKAWELDKPILVSIGYAACHWCHVMERESFENEATAALMNEYFINIKIDREERPDLDHIYMDAVQAMTGSGGWPLNVFLMPDGKPFYGGTYFPPRRAYNRASWAETLQGVHEAYRDRKHELESQAENLTAHLTNANAFGVQATTTAFTVADLKLATENTLKQADTVWGGFGNAPKFPQSFTIQYLLRYHYFTGDAASLAQALLSLDKMIYGGIYDQLGGGFARYSTDAEWLAPHFEKMLYDNALLLSVMAEAYQLTHTELYRSTIAHTVEFIQRELTHPAGGFYSALDADSEGVEGKFYTWSAEEITTILKDDAEIFCAYYDVTPGGNWEHTNILRVLQPLEAFAADKNISAAQLADTLHRCRELLLQERSLRIRPALDDKILLGWNCLLNMGLCQAYAATMEEEYLHLARQNMVFLEQNLCENGEWFHTWKAGKARVPAFLDDLAYLAKAYIHLQEVTGEQSYLLKAQQVTETIIENFSDEHMAMFYFTRQGQADIVVRKKEIYDGATPSGNATMAWVLQYMAVVMDRPEWQERSAVMLGSLQSVIKRYPTSFGLWAQLALQEVYGVEEIAVVGEDALFMAKAILQHYLPSRVFQVNVTTDEKFPLLRNRLQQKTLIYHCKNYVCNQPYSSVQQLLTTVSKQG